MRAVEKDEAPVRAEPQVWLSPEQVCARVPGMTIVKLRNLRAAGIGPAYSKPTYKTVVYAQADVDAWVSLQRVETERAS